MYMPPCPRNFTGEINEIGLRNGWGEMYFNNGSLYGPGGIFIYGDGDRYVGQWQNDTQHGMNQRPTCAVRVVYFHFARGRSRGISNKLLNYAPWSTPFTTQLTKLKTRGQWPFRPAVTRGNKK